jgi:hypothetical protein
MNHTYTPKQIPEGASSILESCNRCGQPRRRFRVSGTLYYRQMDGTWKMARPSPCTREHKRLLLAAEINERLQFAAIEKK